MRISIADFIFFVETTVQSDSFKLAALFFALVSASLSPFIVKIYRRLKETKKQLAYLRTALECQPDGFYLWLYDDVGFLTRTICSSRLCVMLNLSGGYDASFDAVLERLNRTDTENLIAALKNMRESDEPFCLTTRSIDETSRWLISGFRALRQNTDALLDIVWVRDVTQISEKIEDLTLTAENLRARESVFRNIFDAFPFPVWLRGEDLRLVMCNPAYAAAVQANNEQEVLLSSGELIYEKSQREARVLAAAARAAGREHKTQEDVIVNGRRRRLEVSEIPLKKQSDTFRSQTLGFARDITAFQDLNDDLNRHIAAHNGVLEHLKTPVAVFDAGMQLTFYNTAFMNLFDLEEEWLDSSPYYTHFIDILRDKRKLPENRDFNAYKAAELHYFSTLVSTREDTMHLPNGLTLLRTMTPHPLGGLLIVYEDVTGHLALERSMNLMNDTQRALLDAAQEAVLVFSNASRVRFVNKAYEKLWNVSAKKIEEEQPTVSEMLEKQKSFFAKSTHWESFKEQLYGAIAAHGGDFFEILRPDGKMLEFSATLLPDGGILVIYRDRTLAHQDSLVLKEENTRFKRRESLLKTADQKDFSRQNEHAQKTLNDLKEIRTFLQKIQKGETPDEKETNAFLKKTVQLELSEHLDFWRLKAARRRGASTPTVVETPTFVNNMRQMAAPLIGLKGIAFEQNISKAPEYFIADKEMLSDISGFLFASVVYNAKQKTKILLNIEKTTNDTVLFSLSFTQDSSLKDNIFEQTAGIEKITENMEKQGAVLGFEKKGRLSCRTIELPLHT